MTDYNDGKWHGWNGGECPVHPESEVQVIYQTTRFSSETLRATMFRWDSHHAPIVAFRVTKAYVEPPKPREFWITEDNRGRLYVFAGPVARDDDHEIIHVREVPA